MVPADSPVVCVFGSNDAAEGCGAYETARAAGRILAGMGYVVANGGYGGTMAASARGAKEAGGRTIGVTCRIWPTAPNEYIDRVIAAASLGERLETLMELGGGGYVVLPGATGTLAELACVWERMLKGVAPRRPLVCVGNFWRPIILQMESARSGCGDFIGTVETPEQLPRHFPQVRKLT